MRLQRIIRPDFIIAGAPRAGTTWLYENLGQNPRIFLSAIKEPRYLSWTSNSPPTFNGPGDDVWLRDFVWRESDYGELFRAALPGQLIGEASSDYLYKADTVVSRLRKERPDVKIVISLRHPVYRAYSNWLQHVRAGREQLSLSEALTAEEERIADGWAWWWHYAARGTYAPQLEAYFHVFPPEQLLLLRYDDIVREPVQVLRRVCAFLGVEPLRHRGIEQAVNHNRVVRSQSHRLARKVLQPNRLARILVPTTLRRRLRDRLDAATLYTPQISQRDYERVAPILLQAIPDLERVTNEDFSAWRE